MGSFKRFLKESEEIGDHTNCSISFSHKNFEDAHDAASELHKKLKTAGHHVYPRDTDDGEELPDESVNMPSHTYKHPEARKIIDAHLKQHPHVVNFHNADKDLPDNGSGESDSDD